MSEQIFSSETWVVTWVGCEKEAVLSLRTFHDLHEARVYYTQRIHYPGITIERVRTVIAIEKISKDDAYLPIVYRN